MLSAVLDWGFSGDKQTEVPPLVEVNILSKVGNK